MAGVADEDEFWDADNVAATAPPHSSSSASPPSEPKPSTAAAAASSGGGLGRRLLASISLPATFTAAFGRSSAPSGPKPPPAAAGLGLLLHLGPKPSADSSDTSSALQQQHGEDEVLEEQGATAQGVLARQHGDDQVVGHDAGAGEELVVLVPVEEEGRLTAEGGDKEGVADGCSANRNCFSLHDQEEEGEQRASDALRAAMEDQEEVVEQEVATEYYTAVEDQSDNVADQCSNDAPKEIKDDNAVEDQVAVEKEGATKYYTAVEDQSNDAEEQCTADAPRGIKDESALKDKEVVEQEVATEYYTAVEDQNDSAADQCTNDALKEIKDDSVVEDQVVVEKEGAAKYYTAMEDQSNNAEGQCTADAPRAIKDDNIVEDKEVVEQERATIVEGQGNNAKDQCTGDAPRAIKDENVVEDKEVVEQEGTTKYYTAVEDQSNIAAEQCVSDALRAIKDDSFVEDQEVVEQEGATKYDSAVEDQSNYTAELCSSGAPRAVKDGKVLEEKEKPIEQGGPVGILGDQDKIVEQCTGDQLRTATDDNTAQDHEVMDQESAIVETGAIADGIVVEAQEEAVEQSADDESRATKDRDAVEDKGKVVDQGVINKQGAIKDGGALQLQKYDDVVDAAQNEDGISVENQDKMVEQCANGKLRTTTDDNAAKDQEVSSKKVRLYAGYPQRPGKPDCRFYMSTGSGSYGLSCCYNHPRLKAKPEVSSFSFEQGNRKVTEFLELNRVGLPIREESRNCTYYMRNGTCRYGKRCCFNHPEQVLDVQVHMPTGWDDTNFPSSPHSKKSSEHATLDDISSSSDFLPPNILQMLLPPQNMPPATEQNEMKVKKDPGWTSVSDDSNEHCLADRSGGPLCEQELVVYSERPGRLECPFLLKFGDCKFASGCHYYHPKRKCPSRYNRKGPSLAEKLMVHPDKPGEPECPFYMKTGLCKFGAECKFDHPKDLLRSTLGPTTPKGLIAAKERHPAAKTTLQEHIYLEQKYPERPGQPDCRYYMQFGKCKFMSACIFNHPKDRPQSEWRPIGSAHSEKYETWHPTDTLRSEEQCQHEHDIPGMPECPFYMKTGTCRFGLACEFHHAKHRCSSTEVVLDDGTDYESAILS